VYASANPTAHVVYSEPPANSSPIQDFHFSGLQYLKLQFSRLSKSQKIKKKIQDFPEGVGTLY